MNHAEDFAILLDGRDYLKEITKEEEAIAKRNNLVIVFGQSDDLGEFRGAIHDEISACGNPKVGIFKDKLVDIDCFDFHEDREVFKKYGFELPNPNIVVNFAWCPKELNTSWLITVEGAEGYGFDIFEDGDLYCRGVVFSLEQPKTVENPADSGFEIPTFEVMG